MKDGRAIFGFRVSLQQTPWLKILPSPGRNRFSTVSRTLQNDFFKQKEAYIP